MCRILVMKVPSQYNALDIFEEELISNWKSMGAEVDTMNKYSEADLVHAGTQGYDIIFVLNGAIFQIRDEEQLKKYFDAPIYSYYVDHPLHNDYSLRQSVKQRCIMVDKDFATYVDRHYAYANALVMQAGVEGVNSGRAYKDRKYSVVFCGSYRDSEKVLDEIDQENESFRKFKRLMIDVGLKNPGFNMEQIFDFVLNMIGFELDEEEYTEFLSECRNAEIYLRAYYRQSVIKKLIEAGISVDVYGNGWEKLECANKELLVCHSPVDYREMLDVFADARLVINVMPWTKASFHDRVACAMLNGALVITDETLYMREQQLNGNKLVTYSLSALEELPKQVAYWLEHPDEAGIIAKEGYIWAKQNHTWNNRAEQLMTMFKNDISQK